MVAIVCPRCRRLTASDQSRCFHCGAVLGRGYALERWAKRVLGGVDVTRTLLFLIAAIYIVHCFLSTGVARPEGEGSGLFGPLSPDRRVLYALGIQVTVAVDAGEWWRLVTSVFVHLDLLHVACNCLALYFLGFAVEREFGPARMVALFVGSGVLGSAASHAFGYSGGGASGAVFGLIGAMAFFGFKRGGTYGAQVKKEMLLWAAYNFAFGLMIPCVNNVAHAGGFVGGIWCAWMLGFEPHRLVRTRNLLALAAGALVAASWVLCVLHYRENLALLRSYGF